MVTSHPDNATSFSRFAHNGAGSATSAVSAVGSATSVAGGAASVASATGGEYRCVYCNDLEDNLEMLKLHHSFLHSHLEFRTVNALASAADSSNAVASVFDRSLSDDSLPPVSIGDVSPDRQRLPGPRGRNPLKATARKSFHSSRSAFSSSLILQSFSSSPSVSSEHQEATPKKLRRRGYACKTTRARPSHVGAYGERYLSEVSEFGESSQGHCSSDLNMFRTDTALESLTTTVDMGTGDPVTISVPHFSELFDIKPRIVLADVAQAMKNSE